MEAVTILKKSIDSLKGEAERNKIDLEATLSTAEALKNKLDITRQRISELEKSLSLLEGKENASKSKKAKS